MSLTGARLSAIILSAYALVIIALSDIRWDRALTVFAESLFTVLPAWLVFMAIIAVCRTAAEVKKKNGRWLPELIRDVSVVNLLWPPLLYILLLGLFGIFKQHILINAEFAFDHTFYAWDRAIFGTDPWRLSHPSPLLTELLGMSYYGWYAPMMLGTIALSFVTKRDAFRDRYMTAFVLAWVVVGSLMAYLLPAAGPCYWADFVGQPNPYAELMDRIRHDVAVSSSYNPVLDAQAYLRAAYGGESVLGGGISAMPSMHVAVATLFACGAWSIHRTLGIFFGAFALVVWWASVHLGWHYFVDGLIAIPATLSIWWFCGKLFPERSESSQVINPVIAG